jgi:hypothetical protein
VVKGFRADTSLSTSKATRLIRTIAWAHRKNWKPAWRVGFARLSNGSKGKVRNSKENPAPLSRVVRLRSQAGSSRDRKIGAVTLESDGRLSQMNRRSCIQNATERCSLKVVEAITRVSLEKIPLVPQHAGLWCDPTYIVEQGTAAEKILDVAKRAALSL